ncbi:unnamed protein product, partial [Owenia fusiformis]
CNMITHIVQYTNGSPRRILIYTMIFALIGLLYVCLTNNTGNANKSQKYKSEWSARAPLFKAYYLQGSDYLKQTIVEDSKDSLGQDKNQLDSEAETGGALVPKQNVFYLKIHKTGSTTLQNIFLRYGDVHNMTFAMPWKRHRVCYPEIFDKSCLIPIHEKYQTSVMYCFHMRYHKSVRDLMPKNTFYTTSIRSPGAHFLSAFHFHKFAKCYGIDHEDIPWKFFLENVTSSVVKVKQCNMWQVSSKSEQLFEFGVEIPDLDKDVTIKNKILQIEQDFDFIMITDYIHESLVLLADLLNWNLEEVVYFTKMQKNNHDTEINSYYLNLVKKWNKGDAILFDHFNKTFWKKVEIYGCARMHKQTIKLRNLIKFWTEKCDRSPGDPTCVRMLLTEPIYIHELKTKMIYQDRFIIDDIKNVSTGAPLSSSPFFPYHTKLFKETYPRTDPCKVIPTSHRISTCKSME